MRGFEPGGGGPGVEMKKKRIVVLGFMAGMPIAGVVWQHVHYISGLQRLGHDVYYVEDLSRRPYNPITYTATDDHSYAARTLANLAAHFGFEGRWSFCARYLPDPHVSECRRARLWSSTVKPTRS